MPFSIDGIVEKGEGVAGKVFDTPTANITTQTQIPEGIYVGHAYVDAVQHNALICIRQNKPTEIHLLDWDGNLYGKHVECRLVERISPIIPWESEAQMREKIQQDVVLARAWFHKNTAE